MERFEGKCAVSDGQGCQELMEPGRAKGVHELLTRLLGRCTCESRARVHELYTVDGARTSERATA